ncbi:MAG: cupin domain-containing protein [Pseudonocardiales bacterium]|nr:cupin domain-containing protein [Pseudonocardiales bacterium]
MTAPPLAAALGLQPHPEGGWYRRTWTSPHMIDTPRGARPSATAILYLLDAASAWHRVHGAAELWCWHRGSELELLLGGGADAPGTPQRVVLGPDTPQGSVAAGQWQRARLLGDEAALVSCVVSPGFDFADFEMATPRASTP